MTKAEIAEHLINNIPRSDGFLVTPLRYTESYLISVPHWKLENYSPDLSISGEFPDGSRIKINNINQINSPCVAEVIK